MVKKLWLSNKIQIGDQSSMFSHQLVNMPLEVYNIQIGSNILYRHYSSTLFLLLFWTCLGTLVYYNFWGCCLWHGCPRVAKLYKIWDMDMVHGLKVGHLIELRYWQHGGGGGGGGSSCFRQWVPWLTWYSPHPKCGGTMWSVPQIRISPHLFAFTSNHSWLTTIKLENVHVLPQTKKRKGGVIGL